MSLQKSRATQKKSAISAEVHLDTHILVWLYAEPQRNWPTGVKLLLQTAVLRYAPIVRLELHYLHEIGRINVTPAQILQEIASPLGLRECQQPFSVVIEQAQSLQWTHDVFDRLIVAQAIAAKAKLNQSGSNYSTIL